MESLKNWMIDAANILFDDSKNDLRSLPKTVRLQILLVLSFIWTTVFSLYVFSYTTFAFGWAGLYVAHIVFIFVFSKGIEVLTSPNPNSYSIPYDGPLKSAFEKWLPFTKGK